jgi:hypothetical protein
MKKFCGFFLLVLLFSLIFTACREPQKTYTLFYNTNGGAPIESVTLISSQPAPLPVPQNGDLEFLGWYLDNEFKERVPEPLFLTQDLIIYARWNLPDQPLPPKTKANVTVRLQGEEDIVYTVDINTALPSLHQYQRDGYHLFWYTDEFFSRPFDIKKPIEDDIIIYGKWTAIFKTNLLEGELIGLTEYGKTLSAIAVPDQIDGVAVTKLSKDCFRKCENLIELTIGKNVSQIAARPFSGSDKLENIFVDEENPNFTSVSGTLYTADKSEFIAFPKAKQIGQFVVHSNTVAIRNDAFGNCKFINSVLLPSGLQTIDIQAFSDCYAEIIFSEGITAITQNAFSGYKGQNITLPNTVTLIEEYAFKNCVNLKTITLSNSLETIEEMAFYGCADLEQITLPASLQVLDRLAFFNCVKLERITILAQQPPELIGEGAFYPIDAVIYVQDLALYQNADGWQDIKSLLRQII